SGTPSAIAGWAIIRASWPPPITAMRGERSVAGTTGTLCQARPRDVLRQDGRPSAGAQASAGVGHPGRLVRLESEPAAPDRGDQLRPAGVVAELAAHPAEVDVDRLRRGPEGHAPHVAHQLLARHHRAGAGDQGVDEVELLAR